VSHQKVKDALRLLLARKLRGLVGFRRIPNSRYPLRRHDDIRPRQYCTEEAVEAGHIHCIFEAVVEKQKRVKLLDLKVGQRSGLAKHWHATNEAVPQERISFRKQRPTRRKSHAILGTSSPLRPSLSFRYTQALFSSGGDLGAPPKETELVGRFIEP
jgi:hypothetical protein